MCFDDLSFSRVPGPSGVSETRKQEVEAFLRRAGELFCHVTTFCGRETDESEVDAVYNWIRGNYPDETKRFGEAFIAGLRNAQRKIFRTKANGELADDPTTMAWLRAVKSRCGEHLAAKERLLEELRANTPKPPTWN